MNKREGRNLKNNPFSDLVGVIQQQGASNNSPTVEIGTVVSPNPLIVNIGDLPVDKDNLLVADHLLNGYKRQLTIPTTDATGETSEDGSGPHTHDVIKIGIP